MKQSQQRVRDWMMRFGQETHNNNPTIPSLEIRKLRAKLILEEALETMEGLGFTLDRPDHMGELFSDREPSLVAIADGIADSLVVLLGTAVACGIDIEPIFEEVMRSNDSKLWTGLEIMGIPREANFTITCVKEHKEGKKCKDDLDERVLLVKDKDGKVIKSPSYSPANIKL